MTTIVENGHALLLSELVAGFRHQSRHSTFLQIYAAHIGIDLGAFLFFLGYVTYSDGVSDQHIRQLLNLFSI